MLDQVKQVYVIKIHVNEEQQFGLLFVDFVVEDVSLLAGCLLLVVFVELFDGAAL